MSRNYTIRIPKPHQQQLAFINSDAKRQIVKAGRRGGKAQPLTSKIYTPNGFVLMKDIQVGDQVLTPTGGIAIVEDIFPQGIVEIYKITFNDKTSVECTLDHLWEIHEHDTCTKWKQRVRILTTGQIKNRLKPNMTSGRPKIAFTDIVKFNKRNVPLDPYLLGLLIGDGTMTNEIVGFTNVDPYILEQVKKRLPEEIALKRDRNTIDYRLTRKKIVGVGKSNPLITILRKLDLFGKYSYEKHIPEIYKYNSVDVRMEVVKGILDTDGWVDDCGQAWLEQTSEKLANDFAEVIQSLGGSCTTNIHKGSYRVDGVKKEAKDVYSQYIYFKDASQLFSLPSKKIKAKSRAKKLWKYVRKIEFVRKDEAQCIKISDSRGLYLTDNFIVTHNTVGNAIKSVDRFLIKNKRVLYAVPTSDQVSRFWYTVTRALQEPIDDGWYYKNETEHIIQLSELAIKELAKNPENKGLYLNRLRESRIRAKTAWNADTLRGDYADELILDEFQLMSEEAWTLVGSPMLLDNNGNVTFIYTPPSLHSRTKSKAQDQQYAAKLFKKYSELQKTNPRYAAFHFTSMDNPYISKEALSEIIEDMSSVGYRMEILAEDVDEAPGALWTREIIEINRAGAGLKFVVPRDLEMIVVAVDPSATSTGDEAGIIVGAKAKNHGYVISDKSLQGPPEKWAREAINAYHTHKANKIIAESNNGGEMVSTVIHQLDRNVPVELVNASRGKYTRAEPLSVLYTKGEIHHVGKFDKLEDEMCLWVPGDDSPNRMDALVWCMAGLRLTKEGAVDWTKVVGGQ